MPVLVSELHNPFVPRHDLLFRLFKIQLYNFQKRLLFRLLDLQKRLFVYIRFQSINLEYIGLSYMHCLLLCSVENRV